MRFPAKESVTKKPHPASGQASPQTRKDREEAPPHVAHQPISFTAFLNQWDKEHIQQKLCSLWQNWEAILGKELASMAHPLGHKKKTLLIGCEDSMTMQEVRLLQQHILSCVHGFLGETLFNKIHVSLLLGEQTCVSLPKNDAPTKAFMGAQLTGRYLSQMDPTSPIARCYARFVRQWQNAHGASASNSIVNLSLNATAGQSL